MHNVYVLTWFAGQCNTAVYSTLDRAKQAVLALLYANQHNATPTFTQTGAQWVMDQQLHGLENLCICEYDVNPGNPFGVLLDF